jgi:hypothetical protein
MEEITRREFLDKSGKVALGLATGALVAGASASQAAGNAQPANTKTLERDKEMTTKKALKVPMKVTHPPSWLSWVASTTGCLRALGVACDLVDVAGYSGYAFLTNVAEDLHPSGPTAFDSGLLHSGVLLLGRSALVFRGGHCRCQLKEAKDEELRKAVREEIRTAYDFVVREIEAGRPCVIWGTYIPEFGIAVGVEDKKYLVESFKSHNKQPQPPIPFDELTSPGGLYVLAFPSAVRVSRAEADRRAINHALQMLHWPPANTGYRTGQAAYDAWVAALDAGKVDPFGNGFNAQCWAEAKRLARDFVGRLAGRNDAVSKPLGEAASAYVQVAEAMGKVAFLFPYGPPQPAQDPKTRAEGIEFLRAAKAAEAKAAQALAEAAAGWPKE